MDAFSDGPSLVDAAADLMARALSVAGPRTLIVTGGNSPGPVYDRLARTGLGWSATTVVLSDERWVALDSPESNEALIRRRLLLGPAAAARLVPLKRGGENPDSDARQAEVDIAQALPAAVTLLGMGEDGHIASLFPGDPDLRERLDPNGPRLCVGVPVSGLAPFVPRVSLTLRALLSSDLIVLFITGDAKRRVIERVAADGSYGPPVAALLRQSRAPVRVLWAA